MNRCKAVCVSTGKRCKNNSVHRGHCGVHGRVSMRFRDEFSGEQVPNTTEELHRVTDIYLKKLQEAIKKANVVERVRHLRIDKRFKEIKNKYFIGDLNIKLNDNFSFMKGNDAVRLVAQQLHITPAHLIRLCPDIPYFEEITMEQVLFLLHLQFGKEALRMFSEEGIAV